MRHRPDIDGLRAVAVVPVVLFHLGVAGFPGGFVGVDVFFVISGFLITSLILPDIEAARFSLLVFYERRCRRLFPALAVVLAASWAAALVLMFPGELESFSKTLIASTLFVSNVTFAGQAGYFDTAAITKPLLHTWSLAVEEQFYIVYPLLLLTLSRYAPRRVVPALVLLALVSLGMSIRAVWQHNVAAYYLLHVRGFELMIGAVLAALRLPSPGSRALGDAVSLLGLGLILAAVFLFGERTPFPGFAALVPCLGAALLLYAGAHQTGPVQWLLGRPLMVWIGRISYPIYLWHWPLIVFTVYATMRMPGPPEQLLLAAATLVLAALTWRFIEQPIRSRRLLPSMAALYRVTVPVSCVLIALGSVGVAMRGIPQRLPDEIVRIAAQQGARPQLRKSCPQTSAVTEETLCFVGDLTRPAIDFAIIGDSHAEMMAAALGARAKAFGLKGLLLVQSGCPALKGVAKTGPRSEHCKDYMDAAFAMIRDRDIRHLVLAGRWHSYIEPEPAYEVSDGESPTDPFEVVHRGLERTLSSLSGGKIVIMAQVPETNQQNPTVVARSRLLGRPPVLGPTLAAHEAIQARMAGLLSEARSRHGVAVIDPVAVLCPDGQCQVLAGDVLLYVDDDHLSGAGAEKVASLFDDVFRNIASPIAAVPPARRSADLIK